MRRTVVAAGLSIASFLMGAAASSADTFTTLHVFCRDGVCADGANPFESPLIPDGQGNYLGTAQNGGANHAGVLYELTGGTKYKKLFDFPANGAGPLGSLILDTQGDVFGIVAGGATNNGAVYRLHPLNAKRTQWVFDILYSFCPGADACADGSQPFAITYEGTGSGVPYDGVSPLYGTTNEGGANGGGAVFQVVDNDDTWSEKAIHSFCGRPNCPGGWKPGYSLVSGANGVLYGPANGGSQKRGLIYQLTPNAARSKWTMSVLYNFCTQADCADGSDPSGLVLDGAGGLYGVADSGGSGGQIGTLYRIASDGTFTLLHSFCQQADCEDGAGPQVAPTIAPDGTLYGLTSGEARLYHFDPATSAYSVLHEFCGSETCKGGYSPTSSMTLTPGGTLLGTTFLAGSKNDGGIVFSYAP
jgi:uncharacterized repeat protein (TIGR03803 family)